MDQDTRRPEMQVSATEAVWRCALAPHAEALLALCARSHPAALPDDLTEEVDLAVFLGERCELVLPVLIRVV